MMRVLKPDDRAELNAVAHLAVIVARSRVGPMAEVQQIAGERVRKSERQQSPSTKNAPDVSHALPKSKIGKRGKFELSLNL
jgi:hypothetical protein